MEPGKMETASCHVIDGRPNVARQRERLEMLACDGHDTTEAKHSPDLFARTHDIFEDDLRRILAEDWKEGECWAQLITWEIPRLCRGGSRSLTFRAVVHRGGFQS